MKHNTRSSKLDSRFSYPKTRRKMPLAFFVHRDTSIEYREKGSMIVLTLIFGSIFIALAASLTSFVVLQKNIQNAKIEREKALQIAEAGLDYYRWFLAHYPDDMQDGTATTGPYVHDYDDPEATTTGQFSLEISGNSSCGTFTSVDITSTGYTLEAPEFSRTVQGRYARPSVAEYAYIINSNVWAGADREIYGPYHSNGGIRMDGTNYSTVTSAQTDWLCTSSFGCSPDSTENGVFGAGPNYSLWQFPAPNIDFAGISVDLDEMKTLAQADGLYFAQLSGATPRRGYHLIFNGDGTVDVWGVNDSDRIWSYSSEDASWSQRYEVIDDESFIGTYTVPTDCSLLFVEDRVWIEGVIQGKVTVASADRINPTYDTDVMINDSITYSTYDGSDGLTLLAQGNLTIPLLSPDDMELNGIFVAQTGSFGRNHYITTDGPHDVPSAYDSYVTRNSLTINGTIVSDGRVGTKWSCGGTYCSGYNTRVNSYDVNLADDPPPLTPAVSDDYEFIIWREEL